jgi:hypothetical protein
MKMDVRVGTWNTSVYIGIGQVRSGELRKEYQNVIDFVGVPEVRWDRGDTEQQMNIHLSMERGMRIMN